MTRRSSPIVAPSSITISGATEIALKMPANEKNDHQRDRKYANLPVAANLAPYLARHYTSQSSFSRWRFAKVIKLPRYCAIPRVRINFSCEIKVHRATYFTRVRRRRATFAVTFNDFRNTMAIGAYVNALGWRHLFQVSLQSGTLQISRNHIYYVKRISTIYMTRACIRYMWCNYDLISIL